ncbi:MAG: tripartite tricarboxylate transporter TctB family protein [Rhodospirillales bacterium]|nr:tripartite tricarboxylate transporter TctB family protein [Rhodospirillales bacterium]
MFEKYRDAFGGGVILLVAVAMYGALPAAGETVMAGVDLSLAPRLVAMLLGGLSLILLLKGLYAAFTAHAGGTGKAVFNYPGKLVGTIAVTTLAAIAFDTLGFKLTAMLYLFAEGYILSYQKGEFKPLPMAAIALVTPFIIDYVFGAWLSMPLPEGLF